ncbi:MAG: hypothetical protein EOM26_07435 [Alphaproteobacteria bacterium]|nr:hypothetical protein [Alphaproteobacteria bacterium]
MQQHTRRGQGGEENHADQDHPDGSDVEGFRAEVKRNGNRDKQGLEEGERRLVDLDPPAGESPYVSQQIQAERNDPDHRDRCNVGCNVLGDAENQAAGDGCEEEPVKQRIPGRARRSGGLRVVPGLFIREAEADQFGSACENHYRRTGAYYEQKRVQGAPYGGLRIQRGERFDKKRIAQQSKEAPEIARRVKIVRVAFRFMRTSRKDALHRGRDARKRNEREADGHGQLNENDPRGKFLELVDPGAVKAHGQD